MSDISPKEEDLVKRIIQSVYDQLGSDADPELVKKVVAASLDELSKNYSPPLNYENDNSVSIPMGSTRIIITAFGKNRPGVVAMVSECLAKNMCNILDISQKILQEFFALILIVDIQECPISFQDLKSQLGQVGNSLGVRVLAQHEDVFKYQHRV
ncbi:ACT domain-containing protein [candidate division KSB1 bacterium]